MKRLCICLFTLALFSACSSQPAPQPEEATDRPEGAQPSAHGPVADEEVREPPTTDEELIKSAMSAAPPSISQEATILLLHNQMFPKTLREGKNGWTCMPDVPTRPGPDPICLDKNGLEWFMAIHDKKKAPPANKVGIGYMLMGSSDFSNTDPFATHPNGPFVSNGPHIMVTGLGNRLDDLPTTPDDISRPYVMYPKTPYAHLKIPIR